MLKPDQYFKDYLQFEIEKEYRRKAQVSFRRAIREFYVIQRRYVIEPVKGRRVQRIEYGRTSLRQKNQRRSVDVYFNGQKVGQRKKLEINLLMSRLFVLWGRYAKTKPTFSWKSKLTTQTEFECFLNGLLPKLGAKHVRRYAETHWREREKKGLVVVK